LATTDSNNENQDREKFPIMTGGTKPSDLSWSVFLYYLGYDLTVRTDTERLFKNFMFLDKERLKSEKSLVRRSAIIVTFITALGTGIITVAGSWILKIITTTPTLPPHP